MTKPIDLRSDTVTRPTEAMRRAMAQAEVGDDWYGDDPTVNRLEERSAEITGTDAAVYVATGTMANEIALHVLVRSGRLVVCEATSHVAGVEVSSAAVLSGVAHRGIRADRGRLTAELVAAALEPDPYGVEVVDLVSLENPHQIGGGTVMPIDEMRAIRKVADEASTPIYLDGARIFNAAAARGTPVGEYAAQAHAMMFSLSKGLGAPIGSVLCGGEGFVEEARRVKILFGGAWRQAGIMAAAGLLALDEGPKGLEEDHANARRLAEGLSETAPGVVDPRDVETNIVFADTGAIGLPLLEVWTRLVDAGVLTTVVASRIRMLTHRDVSAGDIEEAIEVWSRVVREAGAKAARR